MRLLHIEEKLANTRDLHIGLCDCHEREGVTVPYAILSHRWRTGEILFADVQDREIANSYATRSKRGYNKLRDCCRIVLKQWLNHVWIDTCCIDKSSSAELSEAINSMYKYYTDAQFCITYLDDVADDAPKDSFLEGAVWFSRGWTLQELIASRDLRYYSEGWTYLGSKKKLLFETSRASGVTESILSDPSGLSNVCVSEKMSWAARRTTKRAEDQAYALMGIFGVNMPPLYGEGAENAFRRLQLEIIATTPDHTIFAWDAVSASGDMLAPGVSHFRNGGDYEPIEYDHRAVFQNNLASRLAPGSSQSHMQSDLPVTGQGNPRKPDFSMTNSGLHIQIPWDHLPFSRIPNRWANFNLAFLACRTKLEHDLVAICLRPSPAKYHLEFSRTAFNGRTTFQIKSSGYDHRRLPMASFEPTYISREQRLGFPLQDEPNASNEYVNFHFWLRGELAFTPAFSKHTVVNDPLPSVRERATLPVSSRYNTPRPSSIRYMSTQIFFGNCIHDVVVLTPANLAIVIAFGVVDRCPWIHVEVKHDHGQVSTAFDQYDTVFESFQFPTGAEWARAETRMVLLSHLEEGQVPLVVSDDSTVKVSVGVTKMQNVITSCNVYVQSMRQMLRHE